VTDLLILCTEKADVSQNVVTNGISCPASTPLQFIEHNYPSAAFVTNKPYVFTWTPPATSVGDIIFYVAGNAVNGNNLADAGDHVSTAQYTMAPGAPPFTCANTTTPVITLSIRQAATADIPTSPRARGSRSRALTSQTPPTRDYRPPPIPANGRPPISADRTPRQR